MEMKLHSKISSTGNFTASRGRLSEVASLLEVAIRRQMWREREKISQKPLDSCLKQSVTVASTKRKELK